MEEPERGYLVILILLISQKSVLWAKVACNHSISAQQEVYVGALVPIRESGTKCTTYNLRGLQQLAIIQKAIVEINSESEKTPFNLNLKVYDTCSTVDGATKAVLKGLLTAHSTCSKPPIFLGFIGPDDYHITRSVQQISSVFNKVHIVPFTPEFDEVFNWGTVLSVVTNPANRRAKIISSVLEHIDWNKIVLILEESPATSWQTEHFLNATNGSLCVTNILRIPKITQKVDAKFLSSVKLFNECVSSASSLGNDGIVIMIDDPINMEPLLNFFNDQNAANKREGQKCAPILIYCNKVGLRPYVIPRNMNVILLLETGEDWYEEQLKQYKNATISQKYTKQAYEHFHKIVCSDKANFTEAQCIFAFNEVKGKFNNIVDSSVAPLHYGVHLYWSAVLAAHRVKCGGELTSNATVCEALLQLSQHEWKKYLYRAVTILKHGGKINFEMTLPIRASIFLSTDVTNYSPKFVGHASEDGDLQLQFGIVIPATERNTSSADSVVCLSLPVQTVETVKRKPQLEEEEEQQNERPDCGFVDLFPSIEFRGPKSKDTILWISVVLLSFALFIICCSRCLYCLFKVERSGKSSSSRSSRSAAVRHMNLPRRETCESVHSA